MDLPFCNAPYPVILLSPTYLAACAAAFFLSLLALLAFSASLIASSSLRDTFGILKEGPGPGVMSVSKWKGVPSMLPHVISGEASTPEVTVGDVQHSKGIS